MSLDYADEKYGTAVHLLATGTGSIQERLFSAVMSFHTVQQERDLAEPGMWKEHEAIMEALSNVHDDSGKGYFKATLDRMSDAEGSKIADRIFNLWDLIRDRLAER